MTRRLLLSVLIVLVVPGVARASTFCVGSVACPPGGIAKPGNAAGLQSALSDAAVNNQPDQALIGSGTYVALGVQGFTYSDAEELDITGSGSGSTIIQGSAGASSSAMALSGGASASVLEGVTVRMAAASGLGRGLDVQSWTVRGVSIDALPGAASSGTGVVMGGNAFVESSTVEPSPEFFRGIDAFGPNNVIRGCSVSAPVAIGAAQAAAEIDVARCRVNASRAGISVGGNAASGEVTNSLIRVTESASLEHALHAFTGATLSASNVTLIGSGGPDAGGLTEQANPGTASLSVSSSVVRGFINSFRAAQSGGGTALATVNWSSWDTPSLETGGGNVDEGASNLGPGLDPGFLDAATGDYRLRFDSPLVDAGAAGPGVGPDLSGAIRFVDGAPPFTGPRRDIGAFEYQRAAPDAVASGPATGMTGESLPFTAQSSSDPDPGETLTYVWSFDDGTTATGIHATHAWNSPGTHTATVTASDPAGQSDSAVVALQVKAAGGGADTLAPRLSRARMLRKRFSVGRKATPRSAAHAGSAFLFSLSESATARIRIERATPGRRKAGRCVKPRRRLLKAKRCRRYVGVGTLTRGLAAGPKRVPFSGRLGKRKLPAGPYRALLSATDDAGNRGASRTLTFWIARR